MCGLFGITGYQDLGADIPRLNQARDRLTHRGPDDGGHWSDQDVYLGFRRLAILDLSADGNQPMCSADRKIWITFNGEIYNYIELRNDLIKKGHQFQSESDTEVILKLYEVYGVALFEQLNGCLLSLFTIRSNVNCCLGVIALAKNHYSIGDTRME